MSAFTETVVRACADELALFRNGKNKEYDRDVYRRVGEYWDALATIPAYQSWGGYNGRSDTDLELNSDGEVVEVVRNKNQPWSAAFISWVARQAGAGNRFSYAPSHSVYIVKALKAAAAGGNAKFVARRHGEYVPKVGDLIACERRKNDDASFDTYIDFVKAGRFEAHCDFVVGMSDETRQVITIGGNVSHSVMSKEWPIDQNGRIGNHDPKSVASKVICIIETLL